MAKQCFRKDQTNKPCNVQRCHFSGIFFFCHSFYFFFTFFFTPKIEWLNRWATGKTSRVRFNELVINGGRLWYLIESIHSINQHVEITIMLASQFIRSFWLPWIEGLKKRAVSPTISQKHPLQKFRSALQKLVNYLDLLLEDFAPDIFWWVSMIMYRVSWLYIQYTLFIGSKVNPFS